MAEYKTDTVVEEGLYYDLVLGPGLVSDFANVLTFKVVNKEFGVVEAEGPHEIQARYYLDYHEKQKALYVNGGLSAVFEGYEGPLNG